MRSWARQRRDRQGAGSGHVLKMISEHKSRDGLADEVSDERLDLAGFT
jgi:hypothetical protein